MSGCDQQRAVWEEADARLTSSVVAREQAKAALDAAVADTQDAAEAADVAYRSYLDCLTGGTAAPARRR